MCSGTTAVITDKGEGITALCAVKTCNCAVLSAKCALIADRCALINVSSALQ